MLKNAILLACRAPSVHNSQPWRWVAESGPEHTTVHLFVDGRRTVPATDRSGRQAILSCGAVLDHLRIAMAAAHWQANITRFPQPNTPDQLATVEFSPIDHITAAQRNHAQAILQRRTDRLPFDSPTDWHLFEPVLRVAVDSDTMLDVVSDDQRTRLVEASQLSEVLRRDDPYYHAELEWWTSPFVLAHGVPPDALASAAEHVRVDVGRDFPVRSRQNRRAEISADRSKIVVLSTPSDARADVLRCGEVLSRVLLECTMAGMASCTLTHLIESGESRDIVRGMTRQRGEPQALIRIGIAPPLADVPAPTPRRPLDSVLQIRWTPEKG
ncbi:Acg family FMN-binding oxidoreductase [Mycobacterium canetti]|uniref:Acg family FMN-binding oxidoreductase n=1 Tax=Mycobacterium canetti TaxID=78331 RepID=UPI001E2DDD5D|nr:NAD(P)H nitroreductase [Mycobacterium canetti]